MCQIQHSPVFFRGQIVRRGHLVQEQLDSQYCRDDRLATARGTLKPEPATWFNAAVIIEDELPELELVEASESEEESESGEDLDIGDIDIEWYSSESSDEDEPEQNEGSHENELI